MYKNSFYIFCLILTLFSCSNDKAYLELEVEEDAVKIASYDFAEAFYSDISLEELKNKYPIFFPAQVKDSLTRALRKDTLNIKSAKLAKEVFGDFREMDLELKSVLERLNALFPKQKDIKVYYSVGIFDDYTKPVLYNPVSGDLFVALDFFLGNENSSLYEALQVPEYIQNKLIPEQLIPAIANEVAEQMVPFNPRGQRYLDAMIYEGKKKLLSEVLLGETYTDAQNMAYTDEQIVWCRENESDMWAYFVENDYLFNTENRLRYHFIQPAPYSKFATKTEKESPGRTGVWLGWQMMRKLAQDREEIKTIIAEQEYDNLFQEAKYKP